MTARTKLVLHYAPGILALLKTEPCAGKRNGYGIGHGSCGCGQNHVIHRIVNVTLLKDEEQTWCLQQCLINTSTGTSATTNTSSPSPTGSNAPIGTASPTTPAPSSGR
jgi:hypothetical protein